MSLFFTNQIPYSLVFFKCEIATRTWNVLSRWLELNIPMHVGVLDITAWVEWLHVSLIIKDMIES